jgi:hypothetical protein
VQGSVGLATLCLSASVVTVPKVSELLPNLESLASLLERSTGAQADALALVIAARSASSVPELDQALHAVIESWRTP